jgi:hypothetical protein
MLACLFMLMFVPIYSAITIAEIFGAAAGLGWWEFIDFSAGMLIFGRLCRVLFSVAVRNWRMHRPRPASGA